MITLKVHSSLEAVGLSAAVAGLHHTLDDTLANVDPELLAQNVGAYAALAWWAAELPGELGRAPEPGPPSKDVHTWTYPDGTVVVTESDESGLRLYLPDRAPLLARERSASGVRWAGGGFVFWSKEGEALLDGPGHDRRGCRRAEVER